MLAPFRYSPPRHPRYRLIYADAALLVLNKPAGLLTVPGRAANHQDCLERRVQQDYPTARIVHRLDLATSGLLIMPLSREAHRRLQWQFEQHSITKVYEAMVAGAIRSLRGDVTAPVITDWPNRPKQKVCYTDGKTAHTDFERLAVVKHGEMVATRVRLRPHTGRTHQLRVHMQFIGHPIMGDRLYASIDQALASDRLLLQARELAFTHPLTNVPLQFTLPADF